MSLEKLAIVMNSFCETLNQIIYVLYLWRKILHVTVEIFFDLPLIHLALQDVLSNAANIMPKPKGKRLHEMLGQGLENPL